MSAEPDRPSGRAVERLATGVGDEVSDLRTKLRRALDEADRLQAAGREDLAVTVLEEQRDALMAVHRQLEARLADAVVEREAEGVLAEAASRAPLQEAGAGRSEPIGARGPVAPDHVPDPVGDEHMGLRLVAAAAAAVLGVALLLTPEIGPGSVSAAGSTPTGADAPGDAARALDEGTIPTVPPPVAMPEGDPGEQTQLRDVWALALPRDGAPATADGGRDEDGRTDLTDVVDRLPLPTAATPLGPVTTDPTGLAVDDDPTDEDGGTDGTDPDDGASSADDAAAGGDAEGTDGSGTDATGQPEGEPQGDPTGGDGTDADSGDGTTGTTTTEPSDGGSPTGGDTDGGADADGGEAPDGGGSVDLGLAR